MYRMLNRHRITAAQVTKEWFFSLVYPEPNSGCWLWSRGAKGTGYGAVKIDDEQKLAHRLAWELFRGPVPDSLSVLHKCDVRLCCNPDHLFIGTQKDNLDDAIRKGRALPFREIASLGGKAVSGHKNGRSKLTVEQVAEIRSIGGKYGSQTALARKFGVDRNTIHRTFHGIRYGVTQ